MSNTSATRTPHEMDAERGQLLDFLHRKRVLTVFTPAEILEMFERRVRELNEPGGPGGALKHLRRHAERSLARVIINAGQEVAAADGRIDPREQHILQLISTTLDGPLRRTASEPTTHRHRPTEPASTCRTMSGAGGTRTHDPRIMSPLL